MTDSSNLSHLISKIKPDEIYNLAAQSHVQVSFALSEYTGDVVGIGTTRLLEAIRSAGLEKTVRFYQASTSELFGKVQEIPQTEETPFYPRSPYGRFLFFFTHLHFQELQSYMHTGSLSTIANPMTCMRAMESYLTTKVPAVEKRL